VDQVANYLRSKDAQAMKTDLENLARRQPALVLGGALFLGLIGARFLKSSQRERRSSQSYGRGQRFGDTGYNEFSGSGFAGGYDEFDEEIELREPSTGRGGYQGGGYGGA
jgi:hypothetical protein